MFKLFTLIAGLIYSTLSFAVFDISGTWDLEATFVGRMDASCGSTGSLAANEITDTWTATLTFNDVSKSFTLTETNPPLAALTYLGSYEYDGSKYVKLIFFPVQDSRNYGGTAFSVTSGYAFLDKYYRFRGSVQDDESIYLYEKSMYKNISNQCEFAITRYRGVKQ